jgi:ubiquinone biosynthesis accessory factor UbiJ
MLSQPAISALNHLLVQSGWASQRLVRFAGKTARFNIAPFSFACAIQKDGTLCAAAQDAHADASCVIPPSLLPRLALRDETAHAQITSSGDTALLAEIFYLSRNLRWDAAEDLSRVTGDIIAERAVQFAKSGQQQISAAALNLSQALSEYWTEERPLLAKPTQIAAFAQRVDVLRDDVARLEQRINRLPPSPLTPLPKGEGNKI